MPEIVRYTEDAHRVALQNIYLQARKATYTWLDTSDYRLGDFERDTDGESILVVQDQQVAGFSSVWLPERFLHHLYLSPDRIGEGYGHLLLRETMASLSGPMRLKCLAKNLRALSFYKTHGWQIIGEGHGDDGLYYEMEGIGSV